MSRARFAFPLIALLCLTACVQRAVRPSSAPTPPTVHCEQGSTEDAPAWPDNWPVDGPAWGIQVLGVLTEERQLRANEHQCLADQRAKGVIR